MTKYYGVYPELRRRAGGQRIVTCAHQGMQTPNNSVSYLLSDHPSPPLRAGLGSTSLTADADGNKVLEIRYREASRAALWRVDKACPLRYPAGGLREGEIRATWTSSPSTTPAYKLPFYTYAGQAV